MKKTIDNSLNRGNKSEIVAWGMPDYSAVVAISFGTISANGFVFASKYVTDDYWSIYVNGESVLNGGGSFNNSSGAVFPVSKGDVISGAGGVNLKFYPLKGGN